MGDIVDMQEFRDRKAERILAQKQFHPSITDKGVVGKAHKEIDARLREMGFNPDDFQE